MDYFEPLSRYPMTRHDMTKRHKSAVKKVAGFALSTAANAIVPGSGAFVGAITNGLMTESERNKLGVPNAPIIEPPRTYINRLYGTSVREVRTENGIEMVADVTYSEADQKRLDELNKIYDEMLADIGSLTEISAAIDIPEFQPVIEAQRENQRVAREDAYKQAASLQEENLARRGIENSTSAAQARQGLDRSLMKQASQDQRNLTLFAEDLRNQQLTRSTGLLNFARNEIQNDKTARQNSINSLFGNQQSMFGAQNNAQNASFANQLGAYNLNLQRQQQSEGLWNNVFGQLGAIQGAQSGSGASNLIWPSQGGNFGNIMWN